MSFFEVGKKYEHKLARGSIITIIGPNPDRPGELVVVHHPYGKADSIQPEVQEKFYVPYKEPIKIVQYYNMYPDQVTSGYGYVSRDAADRAYERSTRTKRIGCKRVEFVEGVYDD